VRSAPEFPGLEDRLLVIYDGYCGFCNWSVRWFLKRDGNQRLRFVASDSPRVAALLGRHGIRATRPNSLLVAKYPGQRNERLLSRSTGVLAMLMELPGVWPRVGGALLKIPRPVRDFGYGLIAAVRYRLAGRYAACPIPTADERAYFL
jgi:predicted DCC family thiol-disulfide oxidoreductase YuxK